MENSVSSGSLSFNVDARHLQQLGRELVENKVTAVVELIKNSYDADATTVVVAGFGSSKEGGKILVVDDGSGMDLGDVSNGWMRLSSDEKERRPISPLYGRSRAGRKGIGRFSTQTLASVLELLTTRSGEPSRLRVEFYWDRDYKAGQTLGSVKNNYQRLPADPSAHGTSLALNGLNARWEATDWERVKEAAMLLQPPFGGRRIAKGDERSGVESDPGFRVIVLGDLPQQLDLQNPFDLLAIGEAKASAESEKLARERVDSRSARFGPSNSGRNLADFIDSATANVTGTVDEEGILRWHVTSKIYSIDEERVSSDRYAAVGPFSFEAAYFVYKRDAVGDVRVRVAQEMGRQFGGVRIYRDGLRVMPYGEQTDDWLGLNQISASRTFLPPFGVINMFGSVQIGRRENPGLVDTASREGIVEGPAFIQLKDAMLDALKATALSVAAVRDRKVKAGRSAKRPPSRVELLEKFVAEVGSTLPASDQKVSLLNAVGAVASKLKTEALESDRIAAEVRSNLIDEVSMLRILASLGTASTVFSHEVSAALHRSRAAVDDATRAAGEGPGTTAERKLIELEALSRIEKSLVQLGELSSYIVAYTSESRRRDRTPLACMRVVSDFASAFSSLLVQRSIGITWSVEPRSLRTAAMARSEMEAVLFNLLSNAVKALDRDSVSDRRIDIAVRPSRDSRSVVLRFSDSGVGIPDDVVDRIFDPFVTISGVPSAELGTGTGLGLAVVRDIVDSYSGRVFVAAPDNEMITCFEVHLPRLESQF